MQNHGMERLTLHKSWINRERKSIWTCKTAWETGDCRSPFTKLDFSQQQLPLVIIDIHFNICLTNSSRSFREHVPHHCLIKYNISGYFRILIIFHLISIECRNTHSAISSVRGEDIEINPCFFREKKSRVKKKKLFPPIKQYSYCIATSKNIIICKKIRCERNFFFY